MQLARVLIIINPYIQGVLSSGTFVLRGFCPDTQKDIPATDMGEIYQ